MYIQSPILDQRYAQVRIGPSPYASAKSHKVTWEAKTELPYSTVGSTSNKVPEYFTCRMTMPNAIPPQGPQVELAPQRDPADPSSVMPRTRPPLPTSREDVYKTLQQPNVYWLHPPPTVPDLSDLRKEEDAVPEAPMHPHLSRLQASENRKAANFNPSVAVLSSPSCRLAPREQRLAPESPKAMNTSTVDDSVQIDVSVDPSTLPELTSTATASGLNTSKQNANPGMAKDALSVEYSAEGGYFDSEHYRSTIVLFASTQPNSLTSIAAKAIASAIHGDVRNHN
eukprot:PhF_6_TR44174/c0_g2_i3/m.67686